MTTDPQTPRDEYELADAPEPRETKPAMTVRTAPRLLEYRAVKEDKKSAEPQRIRDFYMPLWLLGGGVAVQIVAALIHAHSGGLAAAVTDVGMNLIVATALMLGGLLLAVRFRGVQLGGFWVAVFKLAAIAVAPAAVVTLLTPALGVIPFGWVLGLIGQFILYFALLGALFDLDESDTWYCVCVIFLVHLLWYFLKLYGHWT